MKITLIILVIVGITWALPLQPKNLNNDFQDILSLIPMNKMKEVVEAYARTDKEVQEVFRFLQRKDVQLENIEIHRYPGVKDLLQYLRNRGVNADEMLSGVLNWIQNIPTSESVSGSRTLVHMVDELNSYMPNKTLLGKLGWKLFISHDLRAFLKTLKSAETHKTADTILARPLVKEALDLFEKLGVHVRDDIHVAYKYLGWN